MVIKKVRVSLRREYVIHAREDIHADMIVEALLRNPNPLNTGWLGNSDADLKALVDIEVEHSMLPIPPSGWRSIDSSEALLFFGGELHHWKDGNWIRRPVRVGHDPIHLCTKYANLVGLEPMSEEQVAELTAESFDEPAMDDLDVLDAEGDPESIH